MSFSVCNIVKLCQVDCIVKGITGSMLYTQLVILVVANSEIDSANC